MASNDDLRFPDEKASGVSSRFTRLSEAYGQRIGVVALFLAIVGLVATYDKASGIIVFFLLFAFFFAYITAPYIRHRIRIWSFLWIRVSSFATSGALIVILLAARFIYNLTVTHTLEISEVFYSILFLNISVALIFLILLSGRVQLLDPKELLIKEKKSNEIYLWKSDAGLIRLIPDRQTMFILGLRAADVRTVTGEEFGIYSMGSPLQSVSESNVIEFSDDFWLVWESERRRIPDNPTLKLILSVGASGPTNISHAGRLRRGSDLPSVSGFK